LLLTFKFPDFSYSIKSPPFALPTTIFVAAASEIKFSATAAPIAVCENFWMFPVATIYLLFLTANVAAIFDIVCPVLFINPS